MLLILMTLSAWAVTQSMGACAQSLPIVDLSYERHQAAYYNETGDFYNFTNIRFAQPPLGELRFSPPAAPIVNRSAVQTGSQRRVCPQAIPEWYATEVPSVFEYLYGINSSSWSGLSGSPDPDETEDCLFLDVVVPKAVFDNAGKGTGVPVIVWIYGGAYTSGSKSGSGSGPTGGLLRRGNNKFVFVAINYRLGAFGFLSGPTFQVDGTANAGLLDQRFALEWVQEYIHLFGGDPGSVMVMGESSGAGSILCHIVAYGGANGPPPFERAILQSAAFEPAVSNFQQEATFQQFLSLLNVTTLSEARGLPSSALIAANYAQITSDTVIGSTLYGPVVDGSFLPALPGLLLLHGQFYHDISVMVGFNQNDGLLFTNLTVPNDAAYRATVLSYLGNAQQDALDYIATTLYPQVFDGSYGYTTQIQRLTTTIQDLLFQCNTLFLTAAFRNQTHNYMFAVPPALHGMDVAYTFYDDEGASETVFNPEVAIAMQEYFTSFSETGVPVAAGQPEFLPYGSASNLLIFNVTGVSMETEGALEGRRCAWWQKGLWT